MYGMQKTTLYLPDDLKAQLKAAARERGWSEARVIREALRSYVPGMIAPKPTIPLFASGDPTLAERVDEALEGFGAS
jgi:Ribbon-helix-helix protein, copG family